MRCDRSGGLDPVGPRLAPPAGTKLVRAARFRGYHLHVIRVVVHADGLHIFPPGVEKSVVGVRLNEREPARPQLDPAIFPADRAGAPDHVDESVEAMPVHGYHPAGPHHEAPHREARRSGFPRRQPWLRDDVEPGAGGARYSTPSTFPISMPSNKSYPKTK
jgi:hypothetical protein